MITDPTWNGLTNNSKVRFGSPTSGAPLTSCSYSGPKASWTYITCSHTMTSTDPQVYISVGNDGSTGNIWIDDFSLTKS